MNLARFAAIAIDCLLLIGVIGICIWYHPERHR